MALKRIMMLSLLLVTTLIACNDDDNGSESSLYNSGSNSRVKRIIGENDHWGKYELQFSYRADGRLDHVWRFSDDERRDTLGRFAVEYDVNYYKFEIIDYVLNIDSDSVSILKELYPTSWEDTLCERRREQTLYSTELSEGKLITNTYQERRGNSEGTLFNPVYMNISSQTLMVENNKNGRPLVIRCYEDIYGRGSENTLYNRTVLKYEFEYNGDELISVTQYIPDSYSETSWTKYGEFSCSNYSGILTGVDSDEYKMRRDSKQAVVALPGENTTYTLNDEGLAIKMESTTGETAVIEYEAGSGNFSELYATPLDRALRKVWVK